MRVTIDQRPVDVEAGTTILRAARRLDIAIPTLCHRDDCTPATSCFLCAVRVQGVETLQPACAAPVREGMVVETDTDEVRAARVTALELLFSDHAGCCVAPCAMTCPAGVEIPQYIRALREGRVRDAHAIVRRRIPFPAVLGRICPAFCQPLCERRHVDASMSIRALHRFAADADCASGQPFESARAPSTGRRVAIVGAGPAGLTAAYYLALDGHACVVFDARGQPGGLLRFAVPDDRLDKSVLDAEIAVIARLGVEWRMGWRLGRDGTLDGLRGAFDVVLLAFGATLHWTDPKDRRVDLDFVNALGLPVSHHGIEAGRRDQATAIVGVFAAGECVTRASNAVYAVAAGRRASVAIDSWLRGAVVARPPAPFHFWRRPLTPDEAAVMYASREKLPRAEDTPAGLSFNEVAREALRCLQCGCAKEHDCKLRAYAAQFHVQPYRFRGARRTLAPDVSHAEIVYEPGKCILCGLCLQIAEQAGEARGLSFAGRGFTTRVVVPLEGSLTEGLRVAARRCAEACPTAAFSLRVPDPSPAPGTHSPGALPGMEVAET